MLIYTCRVTGDEMISDAYDLNPVKDAEGNEVPELFECESMSVNKDSGASVDVGGGNAFGGGGADEEVDDTSENVNNVIDESLGFGYNEVPMGKKDLKDFLKTYCGKVRTMLKDDDKVDGPTVKAFTQAAPTFCKVRARAKKRASKRPTPFLTPTIPFFPTPVVPLEGRRPAVLHVPLLQPRRRHGLRLLQGRQLHAHLRVHQAGPDRDEGLKRPDTPAERGDERV